MTRRRAATAPLGHATGRTAHRPTVRPRVAPRASQEPDESTWVDRSDEAKAAVANAWARARRLEKFGK